MASRYLNSKTVRSFDLTTVCARTRAGKSCPYCYVAAARARGFRDKKEKDYEPYNGWVMALWPETVERLNAVGGIRMFAFSDYEPAFRADVRRFLGDCCLRGLGAKAVTKARVFVSHFHDHPALNVVHVSVDNLGGAGSTVTHAAARRLRERYRKVRVRCVCLNPADLEYFGAQDWVDVITLNHGCNGFHRFTRDERERAAERYGDRLCCTTGGCAGCEIRCRVDADDD